MRALHALDVGLHIWTMPVEIAIRNTASPDDALIDFMQSTYEAAANRGNWDRKALERQDS